MKGAPLLAFLLGGAIFASAWGNDAPNVNGSFAMQPFGTTPDGTSISLYTLANRNGMELAITNYGGAVVSLKVPDRKGTFADVVLGYDSLQGYIDDTSYFGALIGRYGNRIAHGKFTLDGVTYTLAKNNGENSLHGGAKGFNKAVWTAKDISASAGPALQLEYLSKDGEEGYPGNLSVRVTYTLTAQNEVRLEYSATTDKDTVLNLTNHSYFNLAGPGGADILGDELMLKTDRFTPVDAGLIPTGELRDVAGTPFDFRTPTVIGSRINQNDEQLKLARGYDHNWALSAEPRKEPALAARLHDPISGRVLEVWTTEPGIQFYTGNFLDGTARGKGGQLYQQHAGLCLETQHFPDSPNHPAFPSTVLKPGQHFHSITIWKFSAR